jgi:hypothetical protein
VVPPTIFVPLDALPVLAALIHDLVSQILPRLESVLAKILPFIEPFAALFLTLLLLLAAITLACLSGLTAIALPRLSIALPLRLIPTSGLPLSPAAVDLSVLTACAAA